MPGVTEVLCAELLPSVSIQGTRILHAGVSASPGASPPPGASHGSRTGQQRQLPAHGPLPGAGPLGPFQKSVCVCVHCVCACVSQSAVFRRRDLQRPCPADKLFRRRRGFREGGVRPSRRAPCERTAGRARLIQRTGVRASLGPLLSFV